MSIRSSFDAQGWSSRAGSAHAQPPGAVLDALDVDPARGLSEPEAQARRRAFGANRLQAARQRGIWHIAFDQINSIIVYLLAAGAALSLLFGQWAEGAAILVVLAINSSIGFVTEMRAMHSMQALKRLSRVSARVRRGGREATVEGEQLVPGDIVLVEAGDVVPADIRLVRATAVQADESTLTGESVPVQKGVDPVARGAALAERVNLLFKGTAITRGKGEGVVVATGMQTQLGQVAALTAAAEGELSPLEKRLDRLGGQLVWATLLLTAVIAGIGLYSGQRLLAMIETAIALAVAAVPEGLPIVATVALARGMWRMARRNALIKNLSAVETLGATTLIFTDKTGTLTENRMTAVRLQTAGATIDLTRPAAGGLSREAREALELSVLCNSAQLVDSCEGPAGRGDPMELALLAAGRDWNAGQAELLQRWPLVRQEAFSADTRMMASFHRDGDRVRVAVKGAPESVLAACAGELKDGSTVALSGAARERWRAASDTLTAEGLRVLALAGKCVSGADVPPYDQLTLVGLVGLLDPPREDVPEAIAACHRAGVRVVMVTGDHAGTASAIARQVGLAAADDGVVDAGSWQALDELAEDRRQDLLRSTVFARVSPRTKLDLVALHQQHGAVVAMTGDGVNDAPALKKADIGIAMGGRGTQVAREAADMVLRDDAFPSIVAAMHQGRVIFGNIRHFVFYLLSCNLSELLVIGIATLMGLPLPLLPLQILYLNLITDVFPAFALGVGEGDADVMRQPPRPPRAPIISSRRWIEIVGFGLLITAATLTAFVVAMEVLGMARPQAVTVSFLTLASAQLWHVFNVREAGSSAWRNEVTRNPYVWGALALCVALVALGIYVPALSLVLGIHPPGAPGWGLVAIAGAVPLAVGQIVRAVQAPAVRR